MPKQPTSDEILQAARERAHFAMEGEERQKKETNEEKNIQAKRLMARLAMEGVEQRQRREAREKEKKEKLSMHQKINEEVKKRSEEAKLKKQAEETAKEKELTTKKIELKEKKEIFTESQNVIEQLKKEKGSSLNPLHTLESDLSEAVKIEKLSPTKIAIAEQTRIKKKSAVMPAKNTPTTTLTKKIVIFLLLVSFLIASGTGIYWYLNIKPVSPQTPNKTVQSIVKAETSTEINTTKLPNTELSSTIIDLIKTPATVGETINNIYFTKEVLSDGGLTTNKTLLTFPEFLKYSQSAIPIDFSRFVNSYMVGLHKEPNQNSIFLVLKIDLFDNVYNTILDHEKDYVQDIFQSLDQKDITSSSTKNVFSDRLIKNLNTRTLLDDQGKILMIYCFLDRNTLVIAQNEKALYQAYLAYNTSKTTN